MKKPSRLTALLGLIAVTFAIAAVGVFLIDSLLSTSKAKKAPINNKALIESIGGPFTLVNQFGKTVTEADFSDRFMLVYFGSSSDTEVCPTALRIVSDAMKKLGKDQEKVVPIFISIDPGRDNPDKVGKFVSQFDPRMIGLTGTPEQVKVVAKEYKVYAAKMQVEGSAKNDYTMDHSSFIYFVGPNGKSRAIFGNGTTPKTIAARMREFF